jgi:hypothetical protein
MKKNDSLLGYWIAVGAGAGTAFGVAIHNIGGRTGNWNCTRSSYERMERIEK